MFIYLCSVKDVRNNEVFPCGERLEKPSVKDAKGALGTWRCPKHGPVKARRRKRVADE